MQGEFAALDAAPRLRRGVMRRKMSLACCLCSDRSFSVLPSSTLCANGRPSDTRAICVDNGMLLVAM